MAMELSFNGIHLPIDGYEDVVAWCDAHLPMDEVQQAIAPTARQTNLSSLTRPVWGNPAIPKLKLNQWFYPVGLSRWGQMTVAVRKETLEAFTGSSLDGTLKMANGDDTIQTTMTMLPPRPICQFGGSHDDVYLVTFVDDRYWMQWRRIQTLGLADASTWSGLNSAASTGIGASLSMDTIHVSWLKPSYMSDLAAGFGNAALMTDAIAANVGQRIVRNLSGTYSGQNPDTAHAVYDANILNRTSRSGGTIARTHTSAAGLLPENIEVCFPKAEGRILLGCQQGSIRHPVNAAEYYAETVATSGYSEGRNTIPSSVKTFITTAVAHYPGGGTGGNPTNQTDLDNLAGKIAEHFIKWSSRASDVVFNTLRWTPEASHDVIWEMGSDLRVRAFSLPINCEPEYLCHYTSAAYPRLGTFKGQTTGTIDVGGAGYVKLNGGSDMVQVYNGTFTEAVAASANIRFGHDPFNCRFEVVAENCET